MTIYDELVTEQVEQEFEKIKKEFTATEFMALNYLMEMEINRTRFKNIEADIKESY